LLLFSPSYKKFEMMWWNICGGSKLSLSLFICFSLWFKLIKLFVCFVELKLFVYYVELSELFPWFVKLVINFCSSFVVYYIICRDALNLTS
jgi:hypothetical protein